MMSSANLALLRGPVLAATPGFLLDKPRCPIIHHAHSPLARFEPHPARDTIINRSQACAKFSTLVVGGGGTMRTRRSLTPFFVSTLFFSPVWAVSVGLVDDFSTPGTNGWTSVNSNTNPGTDGVGGSGDGYLNIAQLSGPFNFGSHNDGINYAGDWTAAGITQVSFFLNDVNTDQSFSFHFLLTGADDDSTWQYNPGFDPPSESWQQYVVDLNDDTNWTRIRGAASFTDVLASVTNAHFRHDLSPYTFSPNAIAGDIGIDNITLAPEPTTLTLLLGAGLGCAVRRRRRH